MFGMYFCICFLFMEIDKMDKENILFLMGLLRLDFGKMGKELNGQKVVRLIKSKEMLMSDK